MKMGKSIIINEIEHAIIFYRKNHMRTVAVFMPATIGCDGKSFAVVDNFRENNDGGYSWDKVYYTESIETACGKCDDWLGRAA